MEQQENTAATGAPPATTTSPKIEDVLAELEKTRAALKDANKESAERRKKLEAFEADEKKRTEASLSETEKAAKQANELKAQLDAAMSELNETRIMSAIEREAGRLNFADVSDAAKLIDRSVITLDGKAVNGVKEALEKIAKDKPYLLKGATTAAGSVGSPNKPIQKVTGTAQTQTTGGYTTRF